MREARETARKEVGKQGETKQARDKARKHSDGNGEKGDKRQRSCGEKRGICGEREATWVS